MNLDGFHLVESGGRVGPKAYPNLIEQAQPITPGRHQATYTYSDDIPESGRHSDYFFSYADLSERTGRPEEHFSAMIRPMRWRSRLNKSTKVRQVYLMDLIATIMPEVTDFFGHTLEMDLVNEARVRYNKPPIVEELRRHVDD